MSFWITWTDGEPFTNASKAMLIEAYLKLHAEYVKLQNELLKQSQDKP